MKRMTPSLVKMYRNGAWENVKVHAPFLGIHGPIVNRHNESPMPYAYPEQPPWNPPVPCPTPTYDGSGETTHPAVVDFWHELGPGRTFNGYRFWMAHTPYPGQNGRLENPSILVSNNGWDWNEPYGIKNPVVPEPSDEDNGFNADSDLEWNHDLDRFEMIWKWQEFGVGVTYRHTHSYDGITWSPHQDTTTSPGHQKIGGVSPALIQAGPHHWVSITRTGSTSHSTLVHQTAPHPSGPWSDRVECTYEGVPNVPTEHLWHLDATLEDDGYWMLASTHPGAGSGGDITAIYPGRSTDGYHWIFGPPVLEDVPGFPDRYKYRPTFTMHEDGENVRVWYAEMGTMHIWHTLIPRNAWPKL